ncbi:hypothetical protein L3Q82_019886, partial [Scortum barcoo]
KEDQESPLLLRISSSESPASEISKLTAPQIRGQINATHRSSSRHISTSSVQRRLRKSGLYGQITAKKPLLRKSNKQKRFVWAKKHKEWTLDQSKSVWLLRCAHEGDVSGLKELLSKGVDINFQHGAAWVGVVDTQGRDARDLAKEAGHSEVLEELENYGRSTQRDTLSDSSAPQWCSVCCSEYRSSLSSHVSSTLHQFSLRRPSPTPYYCLPPSSNSYKMMVRCGWKPGTGLGPEGEGPKQPVPTVLKRDQQGLGYGQIKRAKVTHFQARDHNAVKPPSKEKDERGGKGQRKEE